MLAYEAHGLLGVPTALWRGVLPDASGLNILFRGGVLFGQVPLRWFSPFTDRNTRLSWRARMATRSIVAVGRLSGVPLPWPEHVELDKAVVVARWAADMARKRGACLLRCNASRALRVAVAAREHGLSLAGVTVMGGGEPPTPAKVHAITETGARWIPTYAFTEAGEVGVGCARPADGEDVHLSTDLLAVIQAPRQIAGSEFTVPAFHFTTLLPTATKIMLNTEIGDYGILEQRSCGCPLGALGLTSHARQIRSFSKLTSEGVALLERDMVRILEEVLPARFGGGPLDYQMVEEEDGTGLTRLTLFVSPRVRIADETAVVKTVISRLAGGPGGIWEQARTLRIARADPVWTARGKLTPLHLTRRPEHPPA